MDELFEIGGTEFYFDLDKISEYIKIDPDISIDEMLKNVELGEDDEKIDESNSFPSGTQVIDVAKWEIVRALIETALNESGIVDESMGPTKLGEQLSIPFRLSFNTLIKNKLIKKNG